MQADVKQVSRDTLYLAVLTTVTILIWIGFEVTRSLTKPESRIVLKQELEPLPGELNQEVIQKLRQRIRIGEEQLQTVTDSGKRVSIEELTIPIATEAAGLEES
ncbi:MAG: hypothetical protein HY381_00795 [Candidatus Chisholmbacteria bacterium]|nr:hypothetical protein [Candidatus Chisholmbacteria bacterium]